jgi:hypothetical protein
MSNDDSTTISVSKDTRDELDALKREDERFFQGEESFDHVIQRLLDDAGDAPADDAGDAPADDAAATDAAVRSALDTIESRTGRIEQAVEELTEGRR